VDDALQARLQRESRGQHKASLATDLQTVLLLLVADEPLPERYVDHPLSGEWDDHRDCHVKPDLVLIYRKPDADTLQRVRLGSHSELSL
jgi:mRNA interferase YafQ